MIGVENVKDAKVMKMKIVKDSFAPFTWLFVFLMVAMLVVLAASLGVQRQQ
jgi:hypothetical protein